MRLTLPRCRPRYTSCSIEACNREWRRGTQLSVLSSPLYVEQASLPGRVDRSASSPRSVVLACNDFITAYDDTPYLTGAGCFFLYSRLLQGKPHKSFIHRWICFTEFIELISTIIYIR